MRGETRRRLSVFAGLAPMLSLGFVAGALANRLAFLGWALGMGACYAVALHRAAVAEVPAAGRLAVAMTVAAVALVLFGHLTARYQEALDLGFRAVLPGLYHPWLTRPAAGYGAGALLGAVALVVYLKHRGRSS